MSPSVGNQDGLVWRRRVFLAIGLIWAFVLLGIDSVSRVLDKEADPDLLTAGIWALMAVNTFVVPAWLFRESSIQRLNQRLIDRKGSASPDEVGKALSLLAGSIIGVPIAMGFALMTMSGDAWRVYIFAPLSLLAGVLLWKRIGTVLDQLQGTPPLHGESSPERGSDSDDFLLQHPVGSVVAITLVLIFSVTNLAEPGTGQDTSSAQAFGIASLVLLAAGLMWGLPRLTGRPPHRLVTLRCAIACLPYVVTTIATRFGSPQWPVGITLIIGVILMVLSVRAGRSTWPDITG